MSGSSRQSSCCACSRRVGAIYKVANGIVSEVLIRPKGQGREQRRVCNVLGLSRGHQEGRLADLALNVFGILVLKKRLVHCVSSVSAMALCGWASQKAAPHTTLSCDFGALFASLALRSRFCCARLPCSQWLFTRQLPISMSSSLGIMAARAGQ